MTSVAFTEALVYPATPGEASAGPGDGGLAATRPAGPLSGPSQPLILDRMRILHPATGLLAASLLAACGGSSGDGCSDSTGCSAGATCVDRVCVTLDAGPAGGDAGVDAGPGLLPDAGRDASRDAGPPPELGRRCDAAHPCPDGLRCADGACHLDCGASPHCGAPEVCCAGAEVCGSAGCATPGASCSPPAGCGGVATICRDDMYCDSALSLCLPAPATGACTVPPATGAFEPELMWEWSGSSAHPEYKGVLVTPMVADVDHDGASDVLVIAYRDPPASFGGTIPGFGILCALSGPGDCAGAAREIFCTDPSDADHLLDSWGHLAVADLDATDGVDELTIIAGLHHGSLGGRGIVAFDERGAVRWVGHDASGAGVEVFYYGGAPAIADLDGDGRAEVIVGSTIFDADGLRVSPPTTEHRGNAGFGPVSVAVDLDPTPGDLEVVAGNAAYESDGTPRWTSSVIGDGYPAVADFDGDGTPEIVVVSDGSVGILRADGTAFAPALMFASLQVTNTAGVLEAVVGRGGPPTVADIDGDGRLEVGVATGNAYLALRVTATPSIELAWARPVGDMSSSITASAMFDFEGDGVAEVIYQDTCRARVYAGSDGSVLMDIPNSSGTATNYPTVADLNADGRAEFVLVADSYYARAFPGTAISCPPSMPLRDGVRVYRDANDAWQGTRAIWNEHTYHVTNVCDGVDTACPPAENLAGAIPRHELPSHASGTRGYRVNARLGPVTIDAADLVVLGTSADLSACPASATLRADVGNRGSVAVVAGTPVTFYGGERGGAHGVLGTVLLDRALPPGGAARVELVVDLGAAGLPESFSFHVAVNDDGAGGRRYRECDTDNDLSAVVAVDCVGLL